MTMTDPGYLNHKDRLNRSMPAASAAHLGDVVYDLINGVNSLVTAHNAMLTTSSYAALGTAAVGLLTTTNIGLLTQTQIKLPEAR